MKRLVIYDLDGTLIDTREDITQAVLHMLRSLQATIVPAEVIHGFVGNGMARLVQRCLGTDDPERVQKGLEVYRAFYERHLLDHSILYPHVREALDYFRSRTQAVITNKSQAYSETLLSAFEIASYFAEVIGGESGYAHKPDPSSIQSLMARYGIGPAEVLMIGDSPVDIETGRRAGVLTAVVVQGFSDSAALRAASPDVLVGDFRELLRVAAAQGW